MDDRPAIFTADFGPTEARVAALMTDNPDHERNVLVRLAAKLRRLLRLDYDQQPCIRCGKPLTWHVPGRKPGVCQGWKTR